MVKGAPQTVCLIKVPGIECGVTKNKKCPASDIEEINVTGQHTYICLITIYAISLQHMLFYADNVGCCSAVVQFCCKLG